MIFSTRLLPFALFALGLLPVSDASAAPGSKDLTVPISSYGITIAEPPDTTLFTLLQPEYTGVHFENHLSIEHQRNFTFNGAGVASGDIDDDGLIDLFLVTEEGQSRLFKNIGNMQFRDITDESGIYQNPKGFSVGAAFGDIDNDGDLDLFLSNWLVSNKLYRNDGKGRFTDVTEASGVAYTGGSTTATFADYDRDGDLDFFVATYRPRDFAEQSETPELTLVNGKITLSSALQQDLELAETQDGLTVRQLGERDLLYRNNGDGTFTEVAEAAGITGGYWGLSASFGDIDNDGWPDLYVTNDFWSPDGFYKNNADGTFGKIQPSHVQQTPMFAMGMDFGDINNDGYADVFVADMLSRDATLRLTQHGLMDTTLPPDESAAQVMHNVLYLNQGGTIFSDIAWLSGTAASEWTWSAKFGDVDLDGYVDLLISNGMIGDLMDSDVLKNINLPQFQNAPAFFSAYPRLATPDMAFKNNGDLTFTEVGRQWGINHRGVSHGATLADLDNDGDLDYVVNHMNEKVSVFQNNAGSHRISVELRGHSSNSRGIGARVTVKYGEGEEQSRLLSTSGGYLSGHAPRLTFGLGNETTLTELLVEWPSGARQTFRRADGELEGVDRHYIISEPAHAAAQKPLNKQVNPPSNPWFTDIFAQSGVAMTHKEAQFNHRDYDGYDDFQDQVSLPKRLSAMGPGVSWVDHDLDGDDDLYITGPQGQAGVIYKNLGNGAFTPIENPLIPAQAEELAGLWLPNGQLVSSFSNVEDRRVPTAAITGPKQSIAIAIEASGGTVSASDADGDGDLDIFVGGRVVSGQWPLPARSALLINDQGRYVDRTQALAPELAEVGLVVASAWVDVDNDADADLLLTTEYGPVKLFLNQEGTFLDATKPSGLDQWHGVWSGVTVGDFNNDGFMDFAAANWGRNTRYQASIKEPLRLFAGDIDGNGDLDIVEAEYVDGVLRPMRDLGMAGADMPFLYEKFGSFRAYAEASLEEIYGTRLSTARSLKANVLDHSVFINDGTGKFDARPLPFLAQATTGYGIATADVDNDGWEDLILVGNFSHMDPEFRQFSGGTGYILTGNGDGTFEPVPPETSGFYVPFDARGLAVSDYDHDGSVDIAVGMNSTLPMLYRNQIANDNCSATVDLQQWTGQAGLLASYRFEFTASGQDPQVKYVQFGSGYLSQNSRNLLFGFGAAKTGTLRILNKGDVIDNGVLELGCNQRIAIAQPK